MAHDHFEISIDLDISRLTLGSHPDLDNVLESLHSPELKPTHHRNDGSETTTAAADSDTIQRTLLSSIASSLTNSDRRTVEKASDIDATKQLPGKKSLFSSFVLSREINEMEISDEHGTRPEPSSSLLSPSSSSSLQQPERLSKSTFAVKRVSDFFLDLSNPSGGANPGITEAFGSMQSRISSLANTSVLMSPGVAGRDGDEWNLSIPSVLGAQGQEYHQEEQQQHQQFLSGSADRVWSGEEIGAVSIITLMVPFILCSNLLVILSIVRFRRLHTPTNYFITSLACVDILVALATPFMITVEVFQFGARGGGPGSGVLLCLLPNRVLMMACGVSLLTLATIAYDRHTALVSPLDYVSIMTARRVAALVSVTWVYSAFIVWLPLLAGWHDAPTELLQCSADLLHGKAHALFLSAIFLPSCVIILVCYARIFSLAHHHAQAIAAVEFAVHRRLQVKFMIKDTKYAKTLALVIGVFLALWLPYLVSVFVKLVADMTLDIWLQTYLVLIAVLNSGINPWIYAFKNKEFRHAFRRLYHEMFRERVCIRRLGRRKSFVHVSRCSSSTPRLSRTDSRMAAAVVDSATLHNVCEKLQRSVDSLDRFDRFHSRRLGNHYRQWRSGPLPESYRALPSVRHTSPSRRQTASCSDLHSAGQYGFPDEAVAILPRSVSVEYLSSTANFSVNDCENARAIEHCDDGVDLQLPVASHRVVEHSSSTDTSTSISVETDSSNLPLHRLPSPAWITTPSAGILLLTSTPLRPLLSSSKSSSKTLSMSALSLSTPESSSSELHKTDSSKSNLTSSGQPPSQSSRPHCDDTVCYVDELHPGLLRTDSDAPLVCRDVIARSSPLPSSFSRVSGSPSVFSRDGSELGRLTQMHGCRTFYSEQRSPSCALDLRVP